MKRMRYTNNNIRKKERIKNIYIFVEYEFLLIFNFLTILNLSNKDKIILLISVLQRFFYNVFYRQKQALFRFYPPFVYNYTLTKKSPLKLIYDGFKNSRFFIMSSLLREC